MQKNSIREIFKNDMSQVIGGIDPGQIGNIFLIGVGVVGGVVITGGAMWIMHSVMTNARIKLEEQLRKEQNNTNKFCEFAKQIHEQCLDLAHNKNNNKNNLKEEL